MNESTKITIDLAKELSPQELEKFKAQAKKAGAESLKKHFLNITIKKEAA